MNKLVKKYTTLIKSNKMTKVEINSMRKALGMSSALNQEEKDVIIKAFYAAVEKKGGIKITQEHTDQGLKYLKNIAWTPKGKVRETKNNPFGYRERAILNEFKEFRLTALEGSFNPYYGEDTHYNSVWTVIGKTGRFDYVQKGQWGIEVIG